MVAPVLGMVPPVAGVPAPAPAASERPAPAQSANRGERPPGSDRGSGPGVPPIAQRIGRAPVLRSDPANAAMNVVGLGPIVPSAPVPVSSGAIVPTVGPASSAANAPLGRIAFHVRPGPVGPSVSVDPSALLVLTASVARIGLPPPPGREVPAESAGLTVASPVFPAARSGRVHRPTSAVANGPPLRCLSMPADRNRVVKPPATLLMSAAT